MDSLTFTFSVIIGLTGLYIAINSIVKHNKLTNIQNDGVATDALIFSVKESSKLVNDGDGEATEISQTYVTIYYPIVEYQDEDGNELVCELKDNYSERKSTFKVGRTIEIVYNKNHPSKATTQEAIDTNWFNLITLFIGLCMFFYSVLNLFG